MAFTATQAQTYMRLGALARLEELESEAHAIRKAYPDLHRPTGGQKFLHTSTDMAPAERPATPKKPQRHLSAKQRKALSQQMKARWAKARQAEK